MSHELANTMVDETVFNDRLSIKNHCLMGAVLFQRSVNVFIKAVFYKCPVRVSFKWPM